MPTIATASRCDIHPTVDRQYLFFATYIYTQSHGTVRFFYAPPQLSPFFLVNPNMR